MGGAAPGRRSPCVFALRPTACGRSRSRRMSPRWRRARGSWRSRNRGRPRGKRGPAWRLSSRSGWCCRSTATGRSRTTCRSSRCASRAPASERAAGAGARCGGERGLRIDGSGGGGSRGFEARTVPSLDIAWAMLAHDDVAANGGLVDEARVNELWWLEGAPKGSARWIDTGWAIAAWTLGRGSRWRGLRRRRGRAWELRGAGGGGGEVAEARGSFAFVSSEVLAVRGEGAGRSGRATWRGRRCGGWVPSSGWRRTTRGASPLTGGRAAHPGVDAPAGTSRWTVRAGWEPRSEESKRRAPAVSARVPGFVFPRQSLCSQTHDGGGLRTEHVTKVYGAVENGVASESVRGRLCELAPRFEFRSSGSEDRCCRPLPLPPPGPVLRAAPPPQTGNVRAGRRAAPHGRGMG
jgi:hypothetical protein